jgi:hypothetical protein
MLSLISFRSPALAFHFLHSKPSAVDDDVSTLRSGDAGAKGMAPPDVDAWQESNAAPVALDGARSDRSGEANPLVNILW